MQVVFMGLPGAGKGTQATAICEDLGIPHVATGDMYRAARSSGTELGVQVKPYLDTGRLVPDDLTIALVRDRLGQADAKNGFLLDGFPRTLPQAEALASMLSGMGKPLTHVLYLEVREEELLARLTGRRVCPNCGASFHIAFNRPAREAVCDRCGGALVQRSDDTPEAVSVRLGENLARTKALADFYEGRGLLRRIDGEQPIATVYAAIREALKGGER